MKKGIKRVAREIAQQELILSKDKTNQSARNKIQKMMSTLSIEDMLVLDGIVQTEFSKLQNK